MSGNIIGVPTGRISGMFIQQQMLDELQYGQAQLARVQMQLATGHQFDVPSDNPIAAMQVISLQRLLDRKNQMQTNLSANQSFLSTTDTALSSVSSLLANARAAVIGVMGTTATDTQRQTVVEQVDQVLQQLVNTGNQQFNGRYLFSGSQSTVQPFQIIGSGIVQYVGNEQSLSSYSDLNQLFSSNVNGSEVFGAISTAVQGNSALTPNLTDNTPLASLRQGEGTNLGSIQVSVSKGGESVSSTVDLSKAATIGDVAALIKANAPSGTTLNVEVTSTGLVVQLASPATGSLSIQEVGGGATAAELGVLHPANDGTTRIVGQPLNPVLRATDSLDSILGARATAVVHSPASDNDFIVQADVPGATNPADGNPLNQVPISFVGDGSAGFERVDYDGTSIVVHIDPGRTNAAEVVAALNAKHDAGQLPFTAALDPLDSVDGGKGLVDVTATAKTDGGWGEAFDKTAGLQVVNGDKTYTISFSSAQTVQDVLNTINGSGAGLLAEINDAKNGINIRSRDSGCDFAIGENGGQTATQLGLRTFTAQTLLAGLNHGRGVQTNVDPTASDFSITRADGVTLNINVGTAKTVGDVLNLINNNVANADGGLVAQLATSGNGIELVDHSAGAGQLTVTPSAMSMAAVDLGLVPAGSSGSVSTAQQTITGSDVNALETESIFTALLRIKQALQSNDSYALQRSLNLLDKKTTDMSFAQAELGAREQSLTAMKTRLDAENIEIQKVKSDQYDVDMEQVATDVTSRQLAYQASLKATSLTFGMSLMNYL